MKVEIHLLDENLEISGRRYVTGDESVVVHQEPKSVCGYKLILPEKLPHIDEVEVGWLENDEASKNQKTDGKRHYLSVILSLPEVPYNEGWIRFRQKGIRSLLQALDMTTYVFGLGVAEKRDEDVFIAELDGCDNPMWNLYFTIPDTWNYSDCIEFVQHIELYSTNHLIPLLSSS